MRLSDSNSVTYISIWYAIKPLIHQHWNHINIMVQKEMYVCRGFVVLMPCFSFHCSLWGPFHVVLFNTIVFLLAMAHLKAVCSDPGVVPLPQNRVDFSDIHSGSVWLCMVSVILYCFYCSLKVKMKFLITSHHSSIFSICLKEVNLMQVCPDNVKLSYLLKLCYVDSYWVKCLQRS
jgi:hypothetical protein